jgi:hypothetical protein
MRCTGSGSCDRVSWDGRVGSAIGFSHTRWGQSSTRRGSRRTAAYAQTEELRQFDQQDQGGEVVSGVDLVMNLAMWCARVGEDLSPEELEQALRIIDEEQEWVCDRGFRALVETVRR